MFDVVETLFSLAPVEEALAPLGVPLPLFFSRVLRDGFALAAAGDHRGFAEVASSVLDQLAAGSDEPRRHAVLSAFSELPPHPDAAPALEALTDAGVPAVVLTNGSAETTTKLLVDAGLDAHVERVVSVDEVRAWKPAPAPYEHAARLLGRRTADLALVAVHSWDVHGARRAGLTTGWCSRLEGSAAAVFEPADARGTDLPKVVHALLRLPR